MDYQKDKERFLTIQIINYLYSEWPNIELFSTNFLERIISFCNFNKQKTLSLLENYDQEQISKMIENYDLKQIEKKSLRDNKLPLSINELKENYFIKSRLNMNNIDSINIWNFISKSVNIIDLKDILHSYDHHKLIVKAKKEVKDKDTKKFAEYFDKFYENRENKYIELFKASLEENDIQFLNNTRDFDLYFKNKKKNLNNKIDHSLFYKSFYENSDYIKCFILDFCDIFTIGKLALVNKHLNSFIFKKFDLENSAKRYCISIFRNTNIYVNDRDKIKLSYKTYFRMLIHRPRIMYSGIYYSKVRFNRVGDNNSFTDQQITTVFNYRFYRFFPDGRVFSITSPYIKSQKLLNAINKGDVTVREGRYYIDLEDILIIENLLNNFESYVYRFKFIKLQEFPNLIYNGLEIINYFFKYKDKFDNLKVNEFFPGKFKFRSMDILKNDFSIVKTLE